MKEAIKYFLAAVFGVGTVLAALHFSTGYIPHLLELIGVTVNIWSIILVRKQNIIGWLVSLISIFCIGIFSIQTGIYGQAMLQFGFFLPTVLYALYSWTRKKNADQSPVWMTARERLMTAIGAITVFIVASILIHSDKGALFHIADIASMTSVMTGFILTALKKKECWLVLTPGNIVIVVLFCMTGGYMVAALNVFFIVNAMIGFLEWTAGDRAQKTLQNG